MFDLTPELLGDNQFKKDYGVRYAYVAGSMYKGISSPQMVICMGKAKLLSYLGTGGLSLTKIKAAMIQIQKELNSELPYGVNLLCNINDPELESESVTLFLAHEIANIEAAAYTKITPAIVHFRLKGIEQMPNGDIIVPNQVLAKVSRPETAELFMAPAPSDIVRSLLEQGKITSLEAELAQYVPLSYDICLEADSGGHTDQRVAFTLIPTISKLRDKINNKYQYKKRIRIGAAGGIGTPEAIAAAFIMGVDFVLTGSINQCTVEAGTSDEVKNILQNIGIQDTAYAPAGDTFEIGARMQVVRKSILFPSRANKLYDLYTHFQSLDELDEETKKNVQAYYFKRSFDEVWAETEEYYSKYNPSVLARAKQNPKQKMALIFRWYFIHTTRLAMNGIKNQISDYQIHCGSSMGAFNEFVKGSDLEDWHNRHTDKIAHILMLEAAKLLNQRFLDWNQL